MGTHILSIGYIPADASVERIVCGDPEASGTKEIDFFINEDFVEVKSPSIEGVTIIPDGEFFLDLKTGFWRKISARSNDFFGAKLRLNQALDRALTCAILRTDPSDKIKIVAEESDGGEFGNYNKEYNGKFYIRYQYQKSKTKYERERVILIR